MVQRGLTTDPKNGQFAIFLSCITILLQHLYSYLGYGFVHPGWNCQLTHRPVLGWGKELQNNTGALPTVAGAATPDTHKDRSPSARAAG